MQIQDQPQEETNGLNNSVDIFVSMISESPITASCNALLDFLYKPTAFSIFSSYLIMNRRACDKQEYNVRHDARVARNNPSLISVIQDAPATEEKFSRVMTW